MVVRWLYCYVNIDDAWLMYDRENNTYCFLLCWIRWHLASYVRGAGTVNLFQDQDIRHQKRYPFISLRRWHRSIHHSLSSLLYQLVKKISIELVGVDHNNTTPSGKWILNVEIKAGIESHLWRSKEHRSEMITTNGKNKGLSLKHYPL